MTEIFFNRYIQYVLKNLNQVLKPEESVYLVGGVVREGRRGAGGLVRPQRDRDLQLHHPREHEMKNLRLHAASHA